MPPTPPLARLCQRDTFRLIPSRFACQQDSVLAVLAQDTPHLHELFELDNATNARLHAEQGLSSGIGIDELVFGIPNFRLVNAAFTYPRPEGSRFNDGERGAWYASLAAETAIAEVVFHKTLEYREIDYYHDQVCYQALLADFNSEFHDLRGAGEFAACLDPGSYLASQKLAQTLLAQGSLGVIYPSVRHPGGTNLACFRPALVGNVRLGQVVEFVWDGRPEPRIGYPSAQPMTVHDQALGISRVDQGR